MTGTVCSLTGPFKNALCLFGAIILLVLPANIRAGDWPQILGPQRNGTAAGEVLSAKWPVTGPKLNWKRSLGSGFSGPAVVSGRVIVFHRVDANERIEALDVNTGKSLWKTDFLATYRGGINPDTGPRCVPLIHGDKIYAFGAAGDLHCVRLADGKKVWSRALLTELGGTEGYFGVGSTPIVVDGRLLVNVGGREQAGICAIELNTGQTLWKQTDERASYSSPSTIILAGKPHALFVTRYNTVAIDPRSGKVAFEFPFGKRGPTVNAATPLVFDGHLFVTSSYGVGAQLARITQAAPTPIWASDEALSSQYNTPVYHDGYLYGIHGREDLGIAELRCVRAKTGETEWSVDQFGVAHIILAGDKMLLVKIDGQIVLAKVSPESFMKLAQTLPLGTTTRSLPALAGGNLYVRDNLGDGSTLRSLRVGGQ